MTRRRGFVVHAPLLARHRDDGSDAFATDARGANLEPGRRAEHEHDVVRVEDALIHGRLQLLL